ncbi:MULTISPECIES: hypothetical protein [unclassified Nostoc]|uniref:hypothetical protein n=1 Tax=unclassified Nostoc TaxID=2593658 RepID=UPI00262C2DC7|nr:hypothetical protein [Nostoc sp. S13]
MRILLIEDDKVLQGVLLAELASRTPPISALVPVISKFANRWGRNRILPIGFTVAAIAPVVLIFNVHRVTEVTQSNRLILKW